MKKATEQLLLKADRSIEAARVLARASDYDFAASRAYYAMFYVAEALLSEHGLHFRKHSAVHAAYGEQFAKTEILDRSQISPVAARTRDSSAIMRSASR